MRTEPERLLRRGFMLEGITLGWNVVGVVVLAIAAVRARSVALAIYITVQSIYVLVVGHHAKHSSLGIAWTAVTAVVMFTLAAGKARTGTALENPVLQTEGSVTFIDGLLATAVMLGLVLNAGIGAWWADPIAGFVIVFYGLREARAIFSGEQ